jgi:hypothetical protein
LYELEQVVVVSGAMAGNGDENFQGAPLWLDRGLVNGSWPKEVLAVPICD